MAVSVTKLMAGTSTQYFNTTVNEVITDHGGGMANYYNAPGTPPGRWLGSALDAIGKESGDIADKEDVTKLYDLLVNPKNDQKLSRHTDETLAKGEVVGGYDLTFSMPKSVNILWACGDEHVRKTIMRCHQEAVQDSLQWFEREQAFSRKGAQGIIKQHVDGVIACTFTHWDTRDHDPHLHDHVLVSNIVRREDGDVGALDGKSLYSAGVSISERHTNLLMDKLTKELGVQWYRRESNGTKASTYDIVGIDETLINAFSQRRMHVMEERNRLIRQAQDNNVPLSDSVMHRINRQAWKNTRKTKPKNPLSLHQLMSKWNDQFRSFGIKSTNLVDKVCGKNYQTLDIDTLSNSHGALNIVGLQDNQNDTKQTTWEEQISVLLHDSLHNGTEQDNIVVEALELLHEEVKKDVTVISDARIRAAAERLTRGIRIEPGQRDMLTERLISAEKNRLVSLTEERFHLSMSQYMNPKLGLKNGRAVTDFEEGFIYATPELLQAEKEFKACARVKYSTEEDVTEQVDAALVSAMKKIKSSLKYPLAPDQESAVMELFKDSHAITALCGPAGTGKTTTLKALVEVVNVIQGNDKVLALAPTSAAAIELGKSLGIAADTTAKVLYEDSTHHTQDLLADAIDEYNNTDLDLVQRRQSLRERIVEYDAVLRSIEIPEHGYVIVDESSMADTFSMTQLAHLCARKHAKMIMVGDNMQLDTPGGGGGAFTWLVSQNRGAQLTSIWRFKDPEEAERSQLIRCADVNNEKEYLAIKAYADAGRIHAGTQSEIEEQLITRMVDDLQNGVDSLLIVGSNEEIATLNERISEARAERGQVESDYRNRVPLSDGSTAGKNDIICTRKNARKLRTTSGSYVKNNDLWIVDSVRHGSLVCHRRYDADDKVVMPSDYVSDNIIGGYAITPHRAQGKTVQKGYYYIPQSAQEANSATLYVSMTRGRESNDVYIETKAIADMMVGDQEGYELAQWKQRNRARLEKQGLKEWKGRDANPSTKIWYSEEDLLPTPFQQAEHRLTEVLNNRKGAHFASDWRAYYQVKMFNLERLDEEWRYYAQVCAEYQLTDLLGEKKVSAMRNDALYSQFLSAYGEAHALKPKQAESIVKWGEDKPLRQVRNQLRRKITDKPEGHSKWLSGRYYDVSIDQSSSQDLYDAADMLARTTDMLSDALEAALKRAQDPETAPKWVNELGIAGEDSIHFDSWSQLVTEVTAFRAAHRITDPDSALGKEIKDDGWRNRIEKHLKSYQIRVASPEAITTDPVAPRSLQHAKELAIKFGRPVLLDAVGDVDCGSFVRVENKDMPGTIHRIRELQGGHVERLAIRTHEPQDFISVWKALTPSERGIVQDVTEGLDHPTELWRSVAKQAQKDYGPKGLVATINGLDEVLRRNAILSIEDEHDTHSKSEVSSPSPSQSMDESFTVEPEFEGPSVG